MKPEFYDPARDGITQGLLGSWRDCREKANLFLKGWTKKGESMGLTYGNVIHGVLENVYEDIRMKRIKEIPSGQLVKKYIAKVEKEWEAENPKADKSTLEYKELSFLIAEATMPVYFEFWWRDLKEIKWLAVEGHFALPYSCLKGRKTILRGKRDGVFTGKDGKLWLFETKTKSRVQEENLIDMLPMDFQVNLYVYNLLQEFEKYPAGCLYNVVRRVGLEQKKAESITQFAKRCVDDIRKRPDFYFLRWEIGLDKEEVDQFAIDLRCQVTEFLDWWYETGTVHHYRNSNMCETKYGRCDMLNICAGEHYARYEKRKQVFRELEDF